MIKPEIKLLFAILERAREDIAGAAGVTDRERLEARWFLAEMLRLLEQPQNWWIVEELCEREAELKKAATLKLKAAGLASSKAKSRESSQ